MDLADFLNLLDTNKKVNVLNKTGDVYHMLLSGFKEDVMNTSVFDDIETYEIESVVVDENFYAGVNIILNIEEDYFALDDEDKSGHIDFYEIMTDTADDDMYAAYDELGFYIL